MKTEKELLDAFMDQEDDYNEHGVWVIRTYTTWNELMPVVEKIDGIYDYDRSMHDKVVNLPVSTCINEVYKAVVEFIKWHNEQK